MLCINEIQRLKKRSKSIIHILNQENVERFSDAKCKSVNNDDQHNDGGKEEYMYIKELQGHLFVFCPSTYLKWVQNQGIPE